MLAYGTAAASSDLLYILGALLTGGLLTFAWNIYRRWRLGPMEDEQTIAATLRDEMETMKSLLGEYRIEVEVTRRQLEDYRRQLHQITTALAESNVRISRLESDLETAGRERADIQQRLQDAIVRRDELLAERGKLVDEHSSLETRIRELEAQLGISA